MEIVYKSDDGLFFSTKEQCEDHEKSTKILDKIAAIQKCSDKSIHCTNGAFIYHEYQAIKAIMEDSVPIKRS